MNGVRDLGRDSLVGCRVRQEGLRSQLVFEGRYWPYFALSTVSSVRQGDCVRRMLGYTDAPTVSVFSVVFA
jgi:hypothetical protein